ncbi:hypothetical protein [Goodfellowiella coeruleoviolacea]|uniref:Uncharacterized protein n=1 Tax=Goodfellowiella coeruleoviolacea TaxID=334858 RepID=A0AAE3GDQ0_9PSEU|nr:hypothetical protein [Goodfellowiella coeruleoviolacea]MCP2166240.1 hypothetical protein [Goodfellowiella coeruleoviolacea]
MGVAGVAMMFLALAAVVMVLVVPSKQEQESTADTPEASSGESDEVSGCTTVLPG